MRITSALWVELTAQLRLEVWHNSEWGTVCDDSFTENSAMVACKQLGYSEGYTIESAEIEEGSGQIWLDEVQCSGEEESIAMCPHLEWGNTDCVHGEDVEIKCYAEGEIVTPNVTLRLVSSTSEERPNRGRVEIFHGSEWGTVCDDMAGVEAAMVICRYLGFTTGTPRPGAYFGAGSGKIWLDNLQCQGDEGSLEECYHHIWGENDCDHSEDFGVECIDAITDATTSTDSTVQPEDGV
ncbi:hypothetical protein CAPTEDRAFT_171985, partial [Capitella teleta]